jgi:hypothetical protein
MKLPHILVFALVMLSAAWAQGQNTSDFLGSYDLLTPGAQATLDIRPTVDAQGHSHAQLTLCIGDKRTGCPSYQLHDQLQGGQLLQADKGRATAIPGWTVKATVLATGREILISMDSGIDLAFRQR